MRNPNGYGCVKKLNGNRRKPWVAIPYQGYRTNIKKTKDEIQFLKDYIDEDLFRQVQEQYLSSKVVPVTRQYQKPIGYYATKKEAIIALAEYNKNPYDLDKANTTFEQIYSHLKSTKHDKMKQAAKTSRTSAYAKFESIKDRKIREINHNMMQAVIDENSNLSVPTQRNMITLCREIFEFALKNDLCEKDYSQFLEVSSAKESKNRVAFSPQEIKTVWENIDYVTDIAKAKSSNPVQGLNLMDTVLLMIYTGVRIGELLSVEKEDVHIEDRYITIRGTKTANAMRYVPIHKDLVDIVKKMAERADKWLITTTKGKQMNYAQYMQFFTHMNEKFNMKHEPHECRYSFATYSAECDMDSRMRGFIMGHSQGNITDDVYTDISKLIPKMVKEIEKYDPMKDLKKKEKSTK